MVYYINLQCTKMHSGYSIYILINFQKRQIHHFEKNLSCSSGKNILGYATKHKSFK